MVDAKKMEDEGFEEENYLRSDVLYKTIVRDMRKYYSKDFNATTDFIRKKRYKGHDYFNQCIKLYFQKKFPELAPYLKNKF